MTSEIVGYKPYEVYLDKWGFATTIVKTEDGHLYFAVRSLCTRLGINSQTQLAMLQADKDYAGALHTFRIVTNGGIQEAECIHRVEAAWWLANISPTRVKVKPD